MPDDANPGYFVDFKKVSDSMRGLTISAKACLPHEKVDGLRM